MAAFDFVDGWFDDFYNYPICKNKFAERAESDSDGREKSESRGYSRARRNKRNGRKSPDNKVK